MTDRLSLSNAPADATVDRNAAESSCANDDFKALEDEPETKCCRHTRERAV
jgi:hypothetical protein